MSGWILIIIILASVFFYLLAGSFMTIAIEWAIRIINENPEIKDEDRWKFILFWPILILVLIFGFLGYFPFWLSKKISNKIFREKDS